MLGRKRPAGWEMCEKVMMDNLKDPEQIDKWKETSDKMKDVLKKLGGNRVVGITFFR